MARSCARTASARVKSRCCRAASRCDSKELTALTSTAAVSPGSRAYIPPVPPPRAACTMRCAAPFKPFA
eukprot:4673025-Pleurochrysis_carterae.AAC.2